MWTVEFFEKIIVGLGLGGLTVGLSFWLIDRALNRQSTKLDEMGTTIAEQMREDRAESRRQVDKLFDDFRTDQRQTHSQMQGIIDRLIGVLHETAVATQENTTAIEALKATVEELKRDRNQ